MIEQFCPNPVVLQRLSTGPLSAHINAVGQQLSQQGYTSSSAQYTMRLLADLSSWLLRQALTVADCNEQLASEFLQDRYRRCRPHLHDRAALRRLLEHLRDQGIIPIPIVETETYDSDRLVGDFQHYLLEQRCLAPTTVDYYIALLTVSKKWTCDLSMTRVASWRHILETHMNRFALILQVHDTQPLDDLA